jgi:hypothetical protein
MVRSTFALAVLALATLTCGCRMCASPYDYCGPTFTGESCQQCLPNVREGSILSQGVPPASGAEMVPGMMLPVPDAEMVGPAPGIQQPNQAAVAVRPQRQTAAAPRRTR